MSFRFGSWPTFNGKKVVLDDDTRLGGGTPTYVAGDVTTTIPGDTQALAFLPIKVDGTLILTGTVVML